jgi:hypothetical protein
VNAILNPWDKLRDLHQLSRLANGNNFESFMKEMINYRINILMTDYQSEVNSLDWVRTQTPALLVDSARLTRGSALTRPAC